ncbi:MAG: hypothetical protein K2L26_02235, partial [Duncaniella sp.]|nr:hypothetical protein [Duncaniella sp.]
VIVAQVEIAGGTYARQNYFFFSWHGLYVGDEREFDGVTVFRKVYINVQSYKKTPTPAQLRIDN